eukprot:TRINITY_DN149_c0_g1_i13.p1 TRINITY_DN149_c0_g1~~TRINITY_DN149_c0_g1_i13.p1  ORF type:complete len:278 (-),score=55.21 TRINITY_DN149_c0_g1_i13:1077-1910(-)
MKRDGTGCLYTIISHCSESEESLCMLQFLLDEGCPLLSTDKFGTTLLHLACRRRQISTVKFLLKNLHPLTVEDNDGVTPLHVICSSLENEEEEQNKNLELLKLLLDSGANLKQGDRVGSLPLHYAVCQSCNIGLVKEMLSRDPDLAFCVDKCERTPLHMVCQIYSNPTVKSLLEGLMKQRDPSFFDAFNPKHSIDFKTPMKSVPKILDEVSVQCIASMIKMGRYKKISVLTGAGLSTSAGIPDFRSPDKGIYSNPHLRQKLGVTSISTALRYILCHH